MQDTYPNRSTKAPGALDFDRQFTSTSGLIDCPRMGAYRQVRPFGRRWGWSFKRQQYSVSRHTTEHTGLEHLGRRRVHPQPLVRQHISGYRRSSVRSLKRQLPGLVATRHTPRPTPVIHAYQWTSAEQLTLMGLRGDVPRWEFPARRRCKRGGRVSPGATSPFVLFTSAMISVSVEPIRIAVWKFAIGSGNISKHGCGSSHYALVTIGTYRPMDGVFIPVRRSYE